MVRSVVRVHPELPLRQTPPAGAERRSSEPVAGPARIAGRVPRFREGISEDDWLRLQQAILTFAREHSGPFHANDVGWRVSEIGVTHNMGDVASILDDLADVGQLERVSDDPPLWALPPDGG